MGKCGSNTIDLTQSSRGAGKDQQGSKAGQKTEVTKKTVIKRTIGKRKGCIILT